MKRPALHLNLSRELSLREKILFGVLGLMLLSLLYLYGVHFPVVNGIEDARSNQEGIEAEIIILQAKKEQMDTLQKELDATLSNPNAVTIPSYDNLDLLMDFLNGVLSRTEDYALTFSGVDLPGGEENSNIARRYMQLTFTSASYVSARGIINDLHGAPYRCLLNDISINPINPNREVPPNIFSDKVQVSLSITFYEVVS